MSVRFITCLALIQFLSGCLAVGVPYTRDSDSLMRWAMQMHIAGRSFRMKEFIDSAYNKYQKAGNKKGMAEAYRFYGKYYRYHPEGDAIDRDPGIVVDHEQLEKSRDYYLKALQIYKEEQLFGEAALTAVETGQAQSFLKDYEKAYSYFNQAEEFYKKFLKGHRASEFPFQINFDNFEKMVAYERELVKEDEGKV